MGNINMGQIARELHDASYPYGLETHYLEAAILWDKHIECGGNVTDQEQMLRYDARGDHCYYTEQDFASAAQYYVKAHYYAMGVEKQYFDALIHECIGLWLQKLQQWSAACEYFKKAADLYIAIEPQAENDAKMLMHSALGLEGEALYCEAHLETGASALQLLDRAEISARKAVHLNPLWKENTTSDTLQLFLNNLSDYREELINHAN